MSRRSTRNPLSRPTGHDMTVTAVKGHDAGKELMQYRSVWLSSDSSHPGTRWPVIDPDGADGADGAALVASLRGAVDVGGNGKCGCSGGRCVGVDVDVGGADICKAVFNISSAAAGCRRFRVVTKKVARATKTSDPLDGVK